MSKKEKLLKKFLETPSRTDLRYLELESLLISLGFEKLEGSGSALKFTNSSKKIIRFHKPHPSNILKGYVVKIVQKILKAL